MNTEKNSVSTEALRNDYEELLRAFNPSYVTICQVPMKKEDAGLMCILNVTVKAPTYYLSGKNDLTPKKTNRLTFEIRVPEGYPKVKPTVVYTGNKRLASVNVFTSGIQCTDAWSRGCSLFTLAKKTISDIVHEPSVTRYNSKATCSDELEAWQRSLKGPTVPMSKILISHNGARPNLPPALPHR